MAPDFVLQQLGRLERGLVLEVVVVPHCLSCARARSLAATIAMRYPTLDVRVVDLAQPDVVAPPGIVAVPAYVLNGRVMFTGNPTPDALATVQSQAGARGDPSVSD
jgi:Thioredoxin domain